MWSFCAFLTLAFLSSTKELCISRMAESSKADTGASRRSAMRRLEDAVVSATGERIPAVLEILLVTQTKNNDQDMRRFVYRCMFDFLSREQIVGNGASLVYPKEILDAIRALYPDGVKDYPPRAGKRKRLYEVSLQELVQEYSTLKRPPSPEY